MKSIAEPG